MAKRTICNMCGKTMTLREENGGIDLHKVIGHGTIFDGEKLDFDCCTECLESFINTINDICIIPIWESTIGVQYED